MDYFMKVQILSFCNSRDLYVVILSHTFTFENFENNWPLSVIMHILLNTNMTNAFFMV